MVQVATMVSLESSGRRIRMNTSAIQQANEARVKRARARYAVVRGARGWGQILAIFTVKREAERFANRAALAPNVQAVSVWTISEKKAAQYYVDLDERVKLNERGFDRIGFSSRLRLKKQK
jgi:hypothetical protein